MPICNGQFIGSLEAVYSDELSVRKGVLNNLGQNALSVQFVTISFGKPVTCQAISQGGTRILGIHSQIGKKKGENLVRLFRVTGSL